MLTLYQTQLRHAFYYQQILDRLAEWYLESGSAAEEALKVLEAERPNIEAGRRWASKSADGEAGALLRDGYAASAALIQDWTTHPRELARGAREGLFAARQLGDRESEGRHLSNLGHACE